MRFCRPSRSMLVALVALFFSLGGAGVAAVSQPTYYKVSSTVQLPATATEVVVACGSGDRISTGGFQTVGGIVTGAGPVADGTLAARYETRYWAVLAHRDPTFLGKGGFVRAFAVCQGA